MTSWIKRPWLFALALIILPLGLWVSLHFLSRPTQPSTPQVVFYGLVVDQDGNPIPGAEVVAKTAKYVSNPVMGGSIPGWSNGTTFRLSTGAAGTFEVRIPAGDEILRVESIRKSGYDWAYDLAWTLGPPQNENDNRQFQLAGTSPNSPGYRPDAGRPAVYPLHLSGSAKAPAKSSRGGFQMGKDGRIVPSKFVTMNVPSTGPSAPRTSQEEAAAIANYLKSMREVQSK